MKNKSKYKINLIIVFIAIIGMVSCDNFFEQQAGNRITPEVHFQNLIDLEISMQGVLVPLQDAMAKFILADGLLSDQMTVTENIDIDVKNVNEHNYTYENPLLNTSGFYQVIINANEVLANIQRISDVDPNFDENYVKQYSNALIGMRSWAYFTLARLNGEVAYLNDQMTSLPKNGLEYIGKEAILDTLINQLLPYLHLDADLEEIFIPMYVNTKILIGEIYLEKDDYANAANFLKLGCESYSNTDDIYKITSKGPKKTTWKDIFYVLEPYQTDDLRNREKENICLIPFKSTDGQYNLVTAYTLPSDMYVVRPSKVLIDLFENQKDKFRGIGTSFDFTADEKPYIKKYAIDEVMPYSTDIVISRAGDVHLLLAEALNRIGEHDIALYLLNDGITNAEKRPADYKRWSKNVGVRGRVSLDNRSVPSDVSNKTEYIENLIIEERAAELAFEGHRYFDLIRISERRNDTEFIAGAIYKKFEDKDLGQRVKEKMRNKENWFVPLNK